MAVRSVLRFVLVCLVRLVAASRAGIYWQRQQLRGWPVELRHSGIHGELQALQRFRQVSAAALALGAVQGRRHHESPRGGHQVHPDVLGTAVLAQELHRPPALTWVAVRELSAPQEALALHSQRHRYGVRNLGV